MGRKTYETMAGCRPNADHASAKAMNEIPKVVFSLTLETADDWPETPIAGGDTLVLTDHARHDGFSTDGLQVSSTL